MADPISFPGASDTYDPAPGTEHVVRPLPCHIAEGEVISCWKLTPEEATHVLLTGEVWVSIKTGGQRLQPVLVSGTPLMHNLNGQPYLAGGEIDENARAALSTLYPPEEPSE